MKKSIYIYIYISCILIIGIALGVLAHLGDKQRYASMEVEFNIEKTLKLNNKAELDFDTQQDFKNFIAKTPFQTYSYNFKLQTHSGVFRRSDLYVLMPNFEKLPSLIYHLEYNPQSNNGSFTSSRILESQLKNIPYTLKINQNLLWSILKYCVIVLIILIICFTTIKNHLSNYFQSLTQCYQTTQIYSINAFKFSLLQKYFSFDFYSYIFYIYIIILSCFIVSYHLLISLIGDDWVYSSTYWTFYQPYTFGGYFWQRGRHFADILMALSMRPFGEILVSFGVAPLMAYRIVSSFFCLVFVLLFCFTLSLLVWILHGKKDFKLIFTILSLFTFILMSWKQLDFITITAYIGTAGFAILIFLPLFYTFFYGKYFVLHDNILIHFILMFFLLYCASFQIEPSTLAIFGLCLFILLYPAFLSLLQNKSLKQSYIVFNNPLFYYPLCLFLVLIPIAFLLTLKSGRGKWQFEKMHDSTLWSSMFEFLMQFDIKLLYLGIFALFFLIVTLYHIIKKKEMTKALYMQIAFVLVGGIGIFGFSAIRVPGIYVEIILLFCVFIIWLLRCKEHCNTIISLFANFFLIALIVSMSFKAITHYEEVFKQNYPQRDSINNLISLFIEADRLNQKEIILTQKDIEDKRLQHHHIATSPEGYPNVFITTWMQYYGYTKNIIKIKVKQESQKD